jgi:hypothetical protein
MRRGLVVGTALLLAAMASPASAAGKSSDYINPECWWDPATASGCSTSEVTALSATSPKVGNSIKFAFQSRYMDSENGTGPWLQLQCYRAGADYQYEGQLSGVRILSASLAGFPGGIGYGDPFSLASSSWHVGEADCVAELGHKGKSGRWVVDASSKFHVSG